MAEAGLALPQRPLNIITTTREYIFRMIKVKKIRGFKSLILDPFTTQAVATTTSMSEILQNQGTYEEWRTLNHIEFMCSLTSLTSSVGWLLIIR